MAKVRHWASLEQGFSDPSNRVRPHWHIEFSHSLLDSVNLSDVLICIYTYMFIFLTQDKL